MTAYWVKVPVSFLNGPFAAQLATTFGPLGCAVLLWLWLEAANANDAGRLTTGPHAIARGIGAFTDIDRVRDCVLEAARIGALTDLEECGIDCLALTVVGFADAQARGSNAERQARHRASKRARDTPLHGVTDRYPVTTEQTEQTETPLNGPTGADTTFPKRPSGERKRDTDRWTDTVTQLAAEHFPDVDVGLVKGAITDCAQRHLDATVDNMRPYIDRWQPAA